MEELFVDENMRVLEALEQLNKSCKKILFVQQQGKLLASITDGDIRRWILKNGCLEASVKELANYNPRYLFEGQQNQVDDLMKRYKIDAVPILDKNMKIIDIIFREKSQPHYSKFKDDIPVVIMAGGLGTRLLPYTNILPKPLLPIGDLPICEHIINQFCNYGCKDFYMIVNYKRNMIKAYFDELDKEYSLQFVVEAIPLGTGGGLSLLKERISSTFILTNCDILIDDDLTNAYEQHKKAGNAITMVCSAKKFKIPYGIIHMKENGEYQSIQEKPQLSFLTNTGCYIIEPTILNQLSYNEKIDFPEIIEKCKDEGYKIGIFPISENAWLDMGQIDELEKMKKRLM